MILYHMMTTWLASMKWFTERLASLPDRWGRLLPRDVLLLLGNHYSHLTTARPPFGNLSIFFIIVHFDSLIDSSNLID
jgi:hypothetical protein